MTPTLKEQIEQWIEREADDYEASVEREIKDLSENDIDHRYTDNAIDDFKAGAQSILPMLLVALEELEFYGNRSKYQDHSVNISIPGNKKRTCSIEDDQGRKARLSLSKIKSMMEGNGNE